MSLKGKIAVVTGASSGFGEAVARRLAEEGVHLALGARRGGRLAELAKELQKASKTEVFHAVVDVQKTESVRAFVSQVKKAFKSVDILVNSAGLALRRDPVATASEDDYMTMMNTNLLGTFRMTQALLPTMEKAGGGHVVNIGSIAGHEPYEGGAGYCASKFAVDAFTRSLRLELIEKRIRVSTVDPGLAETEFSLVRFGGDAAAAKKVYEGMTPLSADDVARAVIFVLSQPPHVNIDSIGLTPLDQGGVHKVYRPGPTR